MILDFMVLVPFAIALIGMSYPAGRVGSSFQKDLETIMQDLLPGIEVHEFIIKKEPFAPKLDERVSERMDVIKDNFDETIYDKIEEYLGSHQMV
jgi:hypothetical protein